jgi:hypothetical protein
MYTDVITLAEAKLYLRVDDTLTEDDNNITRMIATACRYVENATNHIFFPKSKSYLFVHGLVSVYDWPINTAIDPIPDDVTIEVRTLYNLYYHPDATHLGLNVGYATGEVPEPLIEVAYEIIDLLYYGSKAGDTIDKQLSVMSRETLNQFKRFII